jgi:hypothetical protein
MSQTLVSRKALSPVLAAVALACAGVSSAASLSEGFDTVASGVYATAGSPVAGWTALNVSTTPGSTGWFQGNDTVFSAFSGASTSYIGANFNNTTGNSTINSWLWTPSLTFNNGDVIRFYTRTTDTPAYPDRLELRFSTGAVVNPSGPTSVGSFSTLLLSVNPNLTTSGYPNTWTLYSATISGLSGPTAGNVAFRYFVTSGGPLGANSDYIGIDSFSITPVPEPATYGLMGLGIAGVLLAARRRKAA